MSKIKIVSNPYERSIAYYVYKQAADSWVDIAEDSVNSRLREIDNDKFFFPFMAKDIMNTIIEEYYVGTEQIELIFEGTSDEYKELEEICEKAEYSSKVLLIKSDRYMENAREIIEHTKEVFGVVKPIIGSIAENNASITEGMQKVDDALKDIIPICVFGNYSSGKSTFINALIGHEILPSGGEPITAKVYEIHKSEKTGIAKIEFSFDNEPVQLLFEENDIQVKNESRSVDIVKAVINAVKSMEDGSIFIKIYKALNVINSYEKKNDLYDSISDVIHIEIPFNSEYILGRSKNSFVIFDTPGSNSKTNSKHEAVLKDAMKMLSNGIPVWAVQYDSIDSVDNAELCDMIYGIDALDKRFSMIVINKADSVELPRDDEGKLDLSGILDYDAVNKLYSSGIYFVSSVIALGKKVNEGFASEYLDEVYEEKVNKFNNPTKRSYKKLYELNIMPDQIKTRAEEEARCSRDLLYANSGFLSVEADIDRFASKYAAYNKCQMVYKFLTDVMDETDERLTVQINNLEAHIRERTNRLSEKERDLIESTRELGLKLLKENEEDSKNYLRAYISETLEPNYHVTKEEMDELVSEYSEINTEEMDLSLYEDNYNQAYDERKNNLTENRRSLFHEPSMSSAMKLIQSYKRDTLELNDRGEELSSVAADISRVTADNVMQRVVDVMKACNKEAHDILVDYLSKYWISKSEEYKDKISDLITRAEGLSDEYRQELSKAILNFKPVHFEDNTEEEFYKVRFLKGHFFGIQFARSETLNTNSLASKCRLKIHENINDIGDLINNSYYNSFKTWQDEFQTLVEKNITKYNPELREITEQIKTDSDEKRNTESDKYNLRRSFETIADMMKWKELIREGE